MENDDFVDAVDKWKSAARAMVQAEGVHARAYGAAIAKADGKNEAIRAGQAEEATADERTIRDHARIEEQAAKWRVQYLIGQAAQGREAA